MSYYRTYRPQTIADIDNTSVRTQLQDISAKPKKDRPHAYLFHGPRGSGKTTAARLIAKLFLCDKPASSGPCGTCSQCVSVANGTSMDVLEIDAASNRGIDEIRVLRERIGLTPVSASHKVFIIDEVHMLTTEAFNALLKTLEEPPAHAVFVLATTELHKVPATVRSRCVAISFQKADTKALANALARIIKAEKLHVDDDALAAIIGYADGSFRDAVKVLEQAALAKGPVTIDHLRKLLSLTDEKSCTDFIDALLAKNTASAVTLLEALSGQGTDMKSFLTAVIGKLHEMLVQDVLQGKDVQSADLQGVASAIRILTRAYDDMKLSPVAQLPLELAVVEYCGCDERSMGNTDASHEPSSERTMKDGGAPSSGMLTLEKLVSCWPDVIAETKPQNHSIAGVLRSSRPAAVIDGKVTIEAFYKFHQEKLDDVKSRQILADVLKKLFGEKVTVEVILGKK